MCKDEIKNILLDFIVEHDPMNWSNKKIYDKFTEIFYQKFADLETKLLEKKEFCISSMQSLLDINNDLIEENNELKHQLAECEKVVNNYGKFCKITNEIIDNLIKQLKESNHEKKDN